MAKQIIGAQGEITIVKLDALPDVKMVTLPVERAKQGWIIRHSESGQHHVLTDDDVMEGWDKVPEGIDVPYGLTGSHVMRGVDNVPEGMDILYAILEEPASLTQEATVPHERYILEPGIYSFRIAREYDPFAKEIREVVD